MDPALKTLVTESYEYRELLRRRRQLIRPLLFLMLFAYYGFILVLAFRPDILKVRVGDGATTLGICVGVGLIFLTIAVTGIYIHQTDEKSEKLLASLKRKVAGG